MKKKMLKVVAGATLMMAMAVGIQMNNVQNDSSLMMENLKVIAMAQPEGHSGACALVCVYCTCKYDDGWVAAGMWN